MATFLDTSISFEVSLGHLLSDYCNGNKNPIKFILSTLIISRYFILFN